MIKRLLVVDDEPRFGEFVRRVAVGLDFEVEVVYHGNEFRAIYPKFNPDVVVIDLIMPEVDGMELINWITDQRLPKHVIAVTGYSPRYAANAKLLGEGLGLPLVTTLIKPMKVPDLRHALLANGAAEQWDSDLDRSVS